LVNNRRLYCTI